MFFVGVKSGAENRLFSQTKISGLSVMLSQAVAVLSNVQLYIFGYIATLLPFQSNFWSYTAEI